MKRGLLLLVVLAACSDRKPEEKRAPPPPAVAASGKIDIAVTEKGFEPTPIQVVKGQPITLVVTRKTDQTCATELTIPEYKIDRKLPLGQPVEISFTPEKSGDLEYGCAMDHMMKGVLQVR
jgi:plastocyanin domain-containing protein